MVRFPCCTTPTVGLTVFRCLECQLVDMKPFNMRHATMANFVFPEKRPPYRTLSLSRYREEYLIHDANKSTTLLRNLLQGKINSEIDTLLQSYYNAFFKPALGNIQTNLEGKEYQELTTKHIFRDILEEARKMYDDEKSTAPGSDPIDDCPLPSPTFHYGRTRGRPPRSKATGNLKKRLKFKAKTKQVPHLKEYPPSDHPVDIQWDTRELPPNSQVWLLWN